MRTRFGRASGAMKPLFLLASVVAACVIGCEPSQRPLVQAQFCLTPEHGPAELRQAFQAIARDEGMDFLERGDAPDELGTPIHAINNGSVLKLPRGVEMAVSTPDDRDGFSASVSGAPSNQVMMGFSPGHDRKVAEAFARRVIGRLKQGWNVQIVSGNVGMFPLKECTPSLSQPG